MRTPLLFLTGLLLAPAMSFGQNTAGTFGPAYGGVYGGGSRGGYVGRPAAPAAGSAWGHPSGFGNILFPGTGRAPSTPGGTRINAVRPGARVVYWPVGYPLYYQQQPEVIVVQQQPAAAAQPSVIINQHFTPQTANPVVREYNWDGTSPAQTASQAPVSASETARSQAGDEKRPYLIALRDHTIYAAFTYWLEGETLHYVTTHGTHNQVSLSLLDRDFSERLNRERGVPFTLK